jgi:hypothetical protein
VFVTEVRKSERDQDAAEIRGYHEQLCVDVVEPHTDENDGKEVGKCIGIGRPAVKEESECPELGGTEVAEELLPGPLIHLDISTVFIEALDD